MSNEPRNWFDVFISFRGADVRFPLIELLYNALNKNGIMTFKDESDLSRGSARDIMEAIEESRILIVVLSENYFSSRWCLKELAKIIECHDTTKQMVFPIFYNVEPSHVRHLSRSYGEALARVADIKGLLYTDGIGSEDEFVQMFLGFVAQYLFRYDVFLSFRGEDTGYTFTGNLYNALKEKKIKTFFINDDDELLQNSHQISRQSRRAIEEARISIVVLSTTYASSARCLEELAYIMQYKEKKNQHVWPVFYKVKPSHVRRQRGDYAMGALGNENWRKALFQVANLTGFSFQNGYEYELIQRIMKSTVQTLSSYDVFLSFCSEDTRHTFSRYLYNVFCQMGFKTFMDDEGFEDWEQNSQRAIENSRHFVIVFSENYAYSPWCLDELVKILECKERNKKDRLVWPIFYKVEPSDVMEQANRYGLAIAAHEKMPGNDSNKVQKWKSALSTIPCLGGYFREFESESEVIYKETEHENELIKEIVGHLSFPYSGVLDPKRTPSTRGFTIGLHNPN